MTKKREKVKEAMVLLKQERKNRVVIVAIIFLKGERKNSNYVNDIVEIERGERNLIVGERWEKKS